MDSFLERALPLVKRGIHVFPVAPGILGDDKSGKNPLTENGVDDATLDRKKLNEWHAKWPTANVGCAPVGKGFLDDDNGDLAERYEKETEDKFPRTFTVLTSVNGSGLRKKHYYFDSDETTILLGNRKASSPEGGERFSFREHGLYVVGPGSVHWTGAVYTAEDEKAPFALMGKKLANWLEQNSEMEKSKTHGGEGPIAHADWNPDKWMEFYEDAFTCSQDGEWWVSSICPATYEGPGTGRKHEHSTKTGFRFDGAAPEFHCFAGGCPGSGMSFGDVVKHLNKYHGKYPGKIWAEEPVEEILEAFGVEDADEREAQESVSPEEPPEAQPWAGEYRLWEGEGSGIVGIRLSDARERAVDWLWKGRLPAGCGLVISGSPGTNKSMMSLSLVACVTNGWDWPDGEKNTMGPREVLIAATEDDLETTIKPRLMAMGADCSKITAIKNVFDTDENGRKVSRELNLDGDTAKLYALLKANPQILMVVLDPLTGFFGDVDGNDNKKIRPMMQRIAKVCRLTRTAFVLLIHENKRADANAVDRILGAGAVSQVVRAGVRISKDPKRKPDGRIMANIKSSLSRDNGGMRFTVRSKNVTAWDGTVLEDIGYIEWGEKHGMSADDVLDEERAVKKEGGEDTKLGQAIKIFEEALIGGKRLQRDVHRLLDAADISDATKRRAKAKLGVVSSKSAPWYWWLPGNEGEEEIFVESAPMQDTEVM
jgi:hypothetical protein